MMHISSSRSTDNLRLRSFANSLRAHAARASSQETSITVPRGTIYTVPVCEQEALAADVAHHLATDSIVL